MATPTAALRPYVPRIIGEWQVEDPETRWREIECSTVFVDVSGFTSMSERLARHGRIGAEEVTDVIGSTFGRLLDEAREFGGSLLKFGGDALFLLFRGEGHPHRAAAAAHGMRAALRRIGRFRTTAGNVTVRMSVGAHTGRFDFFLVGGSHRELVVAGPAATTLTRMEGAASAGQVLMSPALASALPRRNQGRTVGPGVLLTRDVAADRTSGRWPVTDLDLTRFVPTALRDMALDAEPRPEHRAVTMGFIHFSRFDRLLESSGAEVAADVLDGLVTSVQEAADSRGVAFLGTDIAPDGGKIILAAGAPTVTGEDEELMLLVLRQIAAADHAVPIHIGVNRGPVFAGPIDLRYRRTYTVMGDAVNLAARLMARAEPGQLLTTPEVLAESRTIFATEPLALFPVKGKSEPVRALSVGEPTGSRGQITESGLPLVGRTQELGTIAECWDLALTGTGRLIEIKAEPGMGKSRLVDEFLTGCVGARRLFAPCRLYQATTPYFPFRGFLRQAFDLEDRDDSQAAEGLEVLMREKAAELEPWLSLIGIPMDLLMEQSDEVARLEERFRRSRLEEVVEDLLAAVSTEPAIMVFDDTHWMDEASCDLLSRLASSVEDRPWLIISTRRPGTDGFVAPESLESVVPLALEPLGKEDVSSLILAATEENPLRPRQTEDLVERAEGNPLFLIELLNALESTDDVDALPQSVEGLIHARIDRLSPRNRTLLRHVAVLGNQFRADHVSAVLPDTDDSDARILLRRLSDFLSVGRSGWTEFRHVLIRDVAYAGLPYATRRRLHARVGDSILEAAGDSPEDQAELLSFHYHHAGRWGQAWTYGCIAGDEASAIYANSEAARHYERAIEAGRRIDRDETERLPVVWMRLGDARVQLGSFDSAHEAYRRAGRLVDANDTIGRARLQARRARARERAGRFSAALREATIGISLLDASRSSEAASVRARLVAFKATIRQAQQRPAEAMRLAEAAVTSASRCGDDEGLARAYGVLSWATRQLGRAGADHFDRLALAIFEELDDLSGQGFAHGNLGYEQYFLGRWDDALVHYRKAQIAFERAGNLADSAMAAINIGELLVSQRRHEEAAPILERGIRALRAVGQMDGAAFAEMQVARLVVGQGDLETGARMLESIRGEMIEEGLVATAAEAAFELARCWTGQGRAERSLELLEQVGGELGDDFVLFLAPLSRARAEAAVALGRLDAAATFIEKGLEAALVQDIPYESAQLLLLKARLMDALGEDSNQAASEASQLLRRLGVRTPQELSRTALSGT